MKLLVKEYLTSLRERSELDVLLPDLLSEMGFRVFSRPSIGTRQMGVDVAAVGEDIDGVRKVFLFSIKAGNLTRNDWDGDAAQSLRPSLNEIRDVYVPNRIPKQYERLPIVICITLGGDIQEAVSENVRTYIRSNTTSQISYQEWDGDHLAQLILSGILRENTLPMGSRSLFRKSVALLDEPDVSFAHFRQLLNDLSGSDDLDRKAKLHLLRQINLMLWILLVWSREADNYWSPILCGEYAILIAWTLVSPELENSKISKNLFLDAFGKLVSLQLATTDAFLDEKVFPAVGVMHGLTSVIPSRECLDKNLKLFELISLIAQRGLWLLHMRFQQTDSEVIKDADTAIANTANALIQAFNNNPILATPIKDDQAIDLEITFHFLRSAGRLDAVKGIVNAVFKSVEYAYKANLTYPCLSTDYWDLSLHPKDDEGYRENVTKASILFPILAIWAAVCNDTKILKQIKEFVCNDFAHSTLQLWFPGSESEPLLFTNKEIHGLAFTDVKIYDEPKKMLAQIRREFEATDSFKNLSCVKFGLLPLITLASRHHRIPVCPHLIGPETGDEIEE